MRKLYLFLTFLLSVTCIIALMAASAELYEGYEQQARLERLKSTGEELPATVVAKQIPEQGQPAAPASGSVRVELRAGPRRGEIISVPVGASTFAAISEGDPVQVLVGAEGATILGPKGDGAGLSLAIALLSLVGTVVLARRIRRMPAGEAEEGQGTN